jgi:hypothetical protein
MKMKIKLSALSLLLLSIGCSTAAPFLESDPTLQVITHCGFVIDAAPSIEVPVLVTPTGSVCKLDMFGTKSGAHTATVTFINYDAMWNTRIESVASIPYTFTVPSGSISNAPLNLKLYFK